MNEKKIVKIIAAKIATIEMTSEERSALQNLFQNNSLGDLGELLLDNLYQTSRNNQCQ